MFVVLQLPSPNLISYYPSLICNDYALYFNYLSLIPQQMKGTLNALYFHCLSPNKAALFWEQEHREQIQYVILLFSFLWISYLKLLLYPPPIFLHLLIQLVADFKAAQCHKPLNFYNL